MGFTTLAYAAGDIIFISVIMRMTCPSGNVSMTNII